MKYLYYCTFRKIGKGENFLMEKLNWSWQFWHLKFEKLDDMLTYQLGVSFFIIYNTH